MLLVEPLLEAGADANLHRTDGATALFIAALRGHSEIVAALVEAGADPAKAISDETDVNARDTKGWTALMKMADKGSMLLVEPLLKAGTIQTCASPMAPRRFSSQRFVDIPRSLRR